MEYMLTPDRNGNEKKRLPRREWIVGKQQSKAKDIYQRNSYVRAGNSNDSTVIEQLNSNYML